MNLDDAKTYWQSPSEPKEATMSDSEILALVERRSQAFDKTIRRRDLREFIGAALALVLLAPALLHGPWLTRCGVLLVMAGGASIYLKLDRTRRRHAGLHAEWPLAAMLRAERAKVEAQIHLLESILWWYIAPLGAGAVLVVAGTSSPRFTAGYAIFVALLSWGIYELNQHAVRRELRPRRDELTRLIEQVEE
jgi:hypothetical protein